MCFKLEDVNSLHSEHCMTKCMNLNIEIPGQLGLNIVRSNAQEPLIPEGAIAALSFCWS
jgi:hypothetical protein